LENLVERFGRFFPAGTVLFQEGEAGQEMYVIHSGKVELSRYLLDRSTVLAVLEPGEFFGEMAIVNQRPRSATARCTEDSWLLVIDSETFEMMVRTRVEIAIRLIRTLAGRLQRANEQIEILLVRDANHRVVRALRVLADEMGQRMPDGLAVHIPVAMETLAGRVGLDEDQVEEVLGNLAQARLVLRYEAGGLVLPEVGRLVDFLEYLELKERFAR
jgi:CRP/FNR family transcriptional regulator, cyclic AMP receptor protein